MDKKLLKDKKKIGEGTTGICYELKTGEVVKLFKIPQSISEIEKYKKFLERENDSILFPYDFIIRGKKFLGYITKKASGEIIEKSLRKYSLERISLNSYKLDKDIMYVSEARILINDVHQENMFYDGNAFSIIDTDSFDMSIYDVDDTYHKNIKRVKRAILEVIYEDISNKGIVLNKNKFYLELYKCVTWDYPLPDSILHFKECVEKYCGQKVDSLESVKILKR